MTALVWDGTSQRTFETGVDQGVLYPIDTLGAYPLGVAWNGLTNVTESPSGAEPQAFYADNIKYLTLMSAEEFGCTINAYTYPDEWAQCDGSAEAIAGLMVGQQGRKKFGLAYRTKMGDDVDGQDHGYKLHLVYGAMAAPSEKAFASVNDSPEAIEFSWEVTTTPVSMVGFKPTASLTVDSTKVPAPQMALLEAALYGDESNEPYLPLPDEVLALVTP